MLNIEVIKFEAQDVITASTAAPACTHDTVKLDIAVGANGMTYNATCNGCGATGSGSEVVNGTPVINWD